MKRRIRDTPVSKEEYREEFFNAYQKAIEFYFGNPKEELVYVKDSETEHRLMESILEKESKIIYFLGKNGVGKTTLLKQLFNITDNTTVIDEVKDIMYISMNFRGLPLDCDGQQFLINNIAGACTRLEEEYNFQKEFYSMKGCKQFYDYIKETNQGLLEYVQFSELLGKNEQDIKLIKLQKGEERNPYDYILCKFSFYLAMYCSNIDNIVIILDNMEAMTEEKRFVITKNSLALFSYVLNNLKKTKKKIMAVNLIFSMRESNYEKLIEREEINAYSPRIVLYKNTPINIKKYLEMKKEIVANTDERGWEEAYEIITTLANKFNSKYSEMIKNLCNYDFTIIKKCYKKVLSNKVWLLRGERGKDFLNMSKTDHLFNNISVLRAVACGNNAVYRGEKSKVLPNVLLNNEFYDDSIISLLVMSFMIRRGEGVKKQKLLDVFRYIFDKDIQIYDSVERVIKHFLDIDVFETEYYERQTVLKNKYLKITPRGIEIWGMFKADSVLLEMYREDYYFYEEDNECDMCSSFSLMNTVGQYQIFVQLLHYIEILFKEEYQIHQMVRNNNKLSEYYSCFGRKTQSKRLLEGVMKSIEYSGNINSNKIQEKIEDLEFRMKNIDV